MTSHKHKHNKDPSRLRLLSPGMPVYPRYINSTRGPSFRAKQKEKEKINKNQNIYSKISDLQPPSNNTLTVKISHPQRPDKLTVKLTGKTRDPQLRNKTSDNITVTQANVLLYFKLPQIINIHPVCFRPSFRPREHSFCFGTDAKLRGIWLLIFVVERHTQGKKSFLFFFGLEQHFSRCQVQRPFGGESSRSVCVGMCGSKVGVERGGGIDRFLVGEIQIYFSDYDDSVQLQTASTPSEKPICAPPCLQDVSTNVIAVGRISMASAFKVSPFSVQIKVPMTLRQPRHIYLAPALKTSPSWALAELLQPRGISLA